MSIKTTSLFKICLLALIANTALAQSTFVFGSLPSINFNKNLKNDWSLNFKTESRQVFKYGEFNGEQESEFVYLLTDLSSIVAKETGVNSKLSGGYLIRFRKKSVYHRFIQQFTVKNRLSGLRLVHRFTTDQTLSSVEATEYRLRYRIATEIPLDGQSADPKELYIKFNNEYLNSLQSSEYDLEIRVVPFLGYTLTDNHKVEAGLDYRISSFLNSGPQHIFWISFNWYIQL